jgi:hypothetical protein
MAAVKLAKIEEALKPVENFESALVNDVAGVQGRGRLEKQHVDFLVCHRTMLHASRDDKEFTFFEPHCAISKLHPKAALDHQEEFVFILMAMPDEWSAELGQLNLLAVEFSDDLGFPVFCEERKFLLQIYFFHSSVRIF